MVLVGSKRKVEVSNEDEIHNGRRYSKRQRATINNTQNLKPNQNEVVKVSVRKTPTVKPPVENHSPKIRKQKTGSNLKVSTRKTLKSNKPVTSRLKRNIGSKKLVATPLRDKKKPTTKTAKKATKATGLPKKKKVTKNTLIPRDFVTEYENEPTFETRESIPHVSTVAHSRLLIRAINLNDTKLLKSLINDKKSICSFTIPRSLNINRDALSYAIEKQNMEAIKILLDKKLSKDLASFPDVIIADETTGHNSTMMFGHALRKVCVGRGGKEGNNALLKDSHIYSYNQTQSNYITSEMARESLAFGLTKSFIQKLSESFPEQQSSIYSNYLCGIVYAIRSGHNKLAGQLVEEALTKGGYGFNNLHKEVLLNTNEPLTPFKSVSVIKKVLYNDRVTPLHCAAVNPNADYLNALLNSRPDYSILDTQNWSIMHYAAVCTGTGPLKLLLARGISTSQVNKDGDTPLHLASALGRTENVKLILQNEEKEQENEEFEEVVPKDISGSLLKRANKVGQTALHRAAEAGHSDIVSILLAAGADPDKFTPARYDKLTPFMLAARQGHVNVLKTFLTHGYMKVNAVDHKGRSALAHAIINGQAHVVSYLLRIGANNLNKDTSGNTLVHYAAAYGWYFCLKLLLESGCPANELNDWKMTPLAISFMKGHMGLVEYILKQQGADIDSRVNDNTGFTLLLQAICSKPSSEYLSRLKFLLVDQKANCNALDFDGNNAFHYLVITEHREMPKVANYKSSESQKIIFQATKLLWSHQCNPYARNSTQQTAISLAIKYGCFSILNHLYDLSSVLPEEPNIELDNMLHLMADQAHSEDLIKFCKRLAKDTSKMVMLKRMAVAYNKSGYTPLLWLLHRVTHHQSATNIIDFLGFLVHMLDSDVAAIDREKKSGQSVIHLATSVSYAEEALKVILMKGPQLEVVNYNLQTPLTYAIVKGNEMAAAVLLNHGADVNVRMPKMNSLLLLHAVTQNKSFHLIPLMIDRGANIHEVNKHTKNSVLHYVCRKPHLPFAVESLRKLVEKNIDLDAVNKDGRTALHLAVNFRAGETDASYDIEDLLIESKAKLNIRDHRGRIPLHMAFVKIGKHSDSSFMDPIELVTTLVRAMKQTLPNFADEIRAADEFGMTPLHYAAYRGATISCSYLLMEMHESIDIFDRNGNTPFGLAVLNGHEGCALQFQQKGANFINNLNTNLTQSGEGGDPNDEWVWIIDRKKKEENDRKKLEVENYPILQEVVSKDWQGILHLMLEKLNNSGAGATFPIAAAIKTNRLKLARKLAMRARPTELQVNEDGETLLHTLAKNVARTDDFHNRTLSEQIVNVLIAKGISPDAQDKNQSTALLCAAANKNLIVCNLLGQLSMTNRNDISALTQTDSFGRNAFTALFWNIDGRTEFSAGLRMWAEGLLEQGVNGNGLCRYPIVYPIDFPGERFLHCEANGGGTYTPLMMAVIAGNYTIVEWLLTMVNTRLIDVNYQDADGQTALVHAVKMNDVKMVRLLINPYEGRRIKGSFAHKGRLIFNLTDKKGWTVFDHLVAVHDGNNFHYANTDELVKVLYSAGARFDEKSRDGVSPLERAKTMKRFHLVKCMEEVLKVPAAKRTTLVADENGEIAGSNANLPCFAVITDYERDCQMEMDSIMEVEEESDDDDGIEPDDLLTENSNKNFKVMLDADQQVHYSCCLTKVDISYGFYGLYNFYKMQLVKEDRGTELIVLFTCWGRVGDKGQYQRTPFPSVEQAVKEFKKIFQAKTGNAWDTLNEFTPKPNRYRLVELQTKRVRWPAQVKVDFDKFQRTNNVKMTTLPLSLVKLIENLVMAHKVDVKFAGFDEEFQNNMLGRVSFETLKKGSDLLEHIEELIRKRDELKQKHDYSVLNEAGFMESVLKPCEEFYSLIPVYGFATEKLKPMFTMDELREKQKAISKLIHLEFAMKLIVAAQYNLNTVNPFEYVFRCLNTKIEALFQDDEEAQLILQYVRNTSTHPEYNSNAAKVRRIFRLERAGEADRLRESGIGNRHLLWHGTSAVNLLSILHRGLKVTPLEANLSGYLFGKGIYFADMFMKSQKYSHGSNPKFMFLCEVALGSIHPVKLQHWHSFETSPLPASCHSLKTVDSKWQPDPSTTVIYKGQKMPLGRPVETILPDDEYHGLDHNEFVVFREDQVQLRYLVQYDD
ncbi:hypothetical protein HA402_014123 [Bradysia odoriphaga]|nr:hypothetical protein HA402_014123 [Bradysia odoriphaga]